MKAPMTHNDLVLRAVQWLRAQGYHACLAEPTLAPELPDAIGWNGRGGSAVIECKVSRSDFRADLKKPCHHRPEGATLGNHRWYMTPRGLIRPEEVPTGHGLLEITEKKVFIVVPAPRRQAHEGRRERAMLAVALGRVQREHFGEAFACPEAYMDARIWAKALVIQPDQPDDVALEDDIPVPDLPPVKAEAYRKLSCLDRCRKAVNRVGELTYKRNILTGPKTPTLELLTAMAHLRRAEEILAAAVRRDKVSSPEEQKYA